jgi:hypothetical protein
MNISSSNSGETRKSSGSYARRKTQIAPILYNQSMIGKISSSIKRLGFIQALEVTIYCSLVGLLMWKGNTIFGNTPNFFGPVAVLLLFSVSAMICGLLVFYKPYKLFFADKKKEAIDLVLATTGWLFTFLVIFLVFAAIF